MEDNFPLGRPAWEKVGVQLVQSVKSYEKLKLSVLNVFMLTTAIWGKLCGVTFMHKVLDDVLLLQFGRNLMDKEITPLLDPIHDINLQLYKNMCI